MDVNNDDTNQGKTNNGLIPNLPSFIPVEVQEKSEEDIKREKDYLQKKLSKYGITNEEWKVVSRYKGCNFFTRSTMLHRIDLFNYSYPRFSEPLDNDFFNPESMIDFYCKLYSAMCKFGKRNNKNLNIYRFGFRLFSEEMENTHQTESIMSFSKDCYNYNFVLGKRDVVFLHGILRKGIPCIDFSEFMNDKEFEVVLPPFLDIKLIETGKIIDEEYPLYEVDISKSNTTRLTDEEKEEMESLKSSIIDSKIPHDYYNNWYKVIRQYPNAKGDDEESIKLRNDFLKWQEKLKKYLKLRFREIENELEYHTVEPSEFLKLADKGGINNIMGIFDKIKNIFNDLRDK